MGESEEKKTVDFEKYTKLLDKHAELESKLGTLMAKLERASKHEDEVEMLREELSHYKKQTPILGVIWYGGGSCMIGLERKIEGTNQVILDEYGQEAIIDQSAWFRMRTSDVVKNGVLVRCDDFVPTFYSAELAAKSKFNPNAFTDEMISELLIAPYSEFKKVVDKITHHFPIHRFIDVFNKIGGEDTDDKYRRLSYLDKKFKYLYNFYLANRCEEYELRVGLERAGIPFEGLNRESMVKLLTEVYMNDAEAITN